MLQVNEGESIPLTVTFETVPSAASYRVIDYSTGNDIIGETPLAPLDLQVDFEVSPAGTIITDDSPLNRRAIVVTANYAGDANKQTVTLLQFNVKKL